MSELEEKLSQVLGNPQMMQQIMSLAQAMGQSETQQPASPPAETADFAMMQKVAGMTSGTAVDSDQRALLQALGPYVSQNRVRKLEKAMRAAKMATFASQLLQTQNGR